jgi:hypothetical protein
METEKWILVGIVFAMAFASIGAFIYLLIQIFKDEE